MLDLILPYEAKVVAFSHEKETVEEGYDIEHTINADIIFSDSSKPVHLEYCYRGAEELSPELKHVELSLTDRKTTYIINADYISKHYNSITFSMILKDALPKFYEKLFYNNISYKYIPHGKYDKPYIRVKLFPRKIDLPITLISQNTGFKEQSTAIDLILFFKHDPKVQEAALKIAKDTAEEYVDRIFFFGDSKLSEYKKTMM